MRRHRKKGFNSKPYLQYNNVQSHICGRTKIIEGLKQKFILKVAVLEFFYSSVLEEYSTPTLINIKINLTR